MPVPPGQLTLQLHVELVDVTPAVWRRILVPTSIRMAKLHDIMQAAIGWRNSHLHVFNVGPSRIGMCFDDYPEDEINECDVSVLAALRGKTSFEYEYDFGDSWQHLVTIEAELRTPHALKYAICLDGANACPPEDVGGPNGYEHFLKAINDPSHDEYENYVRWQGSTNFDRTAFDRLEINAMLQKVPQRTWNINSGYSRPI
jgi:hypothetical protein